MAAFNQARRAVTIALLFYVGAAWADPAQLPKEVQRFIDRREGCDHMRGEDGDGDQQRQKEILRELDRYCTGTDKALARLRKKYAENPAVIARLKDFEDVIEAPPEPNPARHRK